MGEELEVVLERCFSPALLPGGRVPPACCCAWQGSFSLSRSVPRPGQRLPGGLWTRGLSGRGNESPGRDRCAAHTRLHIQPTLQAHGHSSHLLSTAQDTTRSEVQDRKDKQTRPDARRIHSLNSPGFLAIFSLYVFCLFFLLAA